MTRGSIERVDVEPGRTVVHLHGEIDLAAEEDLIAALTEVRADGELVLDLAGVTFMDSRGMAVLVTCMNQRAADGCRVRVQRPTARVRRLLEIAGLQQLTDPA